MTVGVADLRQPTMTIGVDTGKSVGIAALLNYHKFRVYQMKIDTAAGVAAMDAALFDLFLMAKERNYRLLVGCERFVVNRQTGMKSQQNDALMVQGIVRAISPVDVEMQSVATASRFADNDRLRKFNLWTTASEVGQPDADDANSAMRHAVLLLARKSATLYEQLVNRTA